MEIPRANMRPMPPDFPEAALTMNQRELMRRFKCRISVVRRWCSECGVDCRKRPLTEPPDGFLESAPSMTVKELCAYYQRGPNLIRRWLRENGVSAKNTRGHYVKHDLAEEIRICTTCPYPECRLVNHKSCKRIGV